MMNREGHMETEDWIALTIALLVTLILILTLLFLWRESTWNDNYTNLGLVNLLLN